MAMTLKSAVIALTLFGGALGIYRYTQDLHIADLGNDKISKEYEATNFNGISYDKTGKAQKAILAKKATYNEDTNIIEFDSPIVRSIKYSASGDIEIWKMQANYGQMRNNDYAEMIGHVVLSPEFKGSAIQKATSALAHYDFSSNTVISPGETVIVGNGWINSGKGFKFDLNTEHMTYKSNVNATYFPSATNIH